MSAKTRGFVCASLLFILSEPASLSAATRVKARLLTRVSSYHSKTGDSVEALVVPPACPQPVHAFPPLTVLAGRIQKVHRVGLGVAHETARLRLQFSELRFPDGNSFQIQSRL